MKTSIGHVIRILLVAIITFAVLVTGFMAFSPSGTAAQLPSSGIPLYDRFAILVDSDLQASQYDLLVPDDYVAGSGLQLNSQAGRISSARLLQWQDDYTDDPRYWQACWLLRAKAGEAGYMLPEVWYCPDFDSAWERGIRDEGSAYIMLMQSRGEDKAELLNECRKLWPDNAYWHYRAAELAIELGDLDEFNSCMSNGNAASRNEFPRPWPISLVAAGTDLPADLDSLAVQGVISQLARSQREGALRSPPDPLSIIEAGQLDPEAVEEYVQMQVRTAAMRGNGLEQLWRPAVALNRLLSNEELGLEWNEADRRRLAEMRSLAADLAQQEMDAFFGAGYARTGDASSAAAEGDETYTRDQLSWINTLQSYRLDLQRARERSRRFLELLDERSFASSRHQAEFQDR